MSGHGVPDSKLTVIKETEPYVTSGENKQVQYLCQCDCGSKPIEVKNNMLQSGWKKSCGCLQSQGEFVIEQILKNNNIQYIKEYSFQDLKVKNFLRFDFAIFENNQLSYLIEFDEKQHFTGPEAKWKNSHSLEKIQEYDKIKNDYCKKNNILLKRIPYTDLKELTYENIIGNNYNLI